MLQLRTIPYRLGLSRLCLITIGLHFLACLLVESHLPPGLTIFHPPVFDGTLMLLLLDSSVLFTLWHFHHDRARLRHYPFILGSAAICLLVLSLCCYVKAVIPQLAPYRVDPALARIDLWLHGGHTPFDLLFPLFTPHLVSLLDQAYGTGWFLAMYAYTFWQLFRCSGPGRVRYLSTFLMGWMILGNGMALLFPSVGPTYYSLFYHDGLSPFSDALFQKLNDVHALYPLTDAVRTRQTLLDWMHDTAHPHISAISAMPSMHVGVAFLFLLHSYRYARRLLWCTVPFALMVLTGSVVLGWHYAIDGYAAALGFSVLWWLNGWELRRYPPSAPGDIDKPAHPR